MARSPDLDHRLGPRSGSIHRIQENHMTLHHILWHPVHRFVAEDRGKAMGAAG
jgi:hypothetical protein